MARRSSIPLPMPTPPPVTDPANLDGEGDKTGAGSSTIERPSWATSTPSYSDRCSPAQSPPPCHHTHHDRAISSSSSSSASGSGSYTRSSSFQSPQSESGSHASSHVHSSASSPVGSVNSCSASLDVQVLGDDGDSVEDGVEEVPSDDEVNLSQGLSLCLISWPPMMRMPERL